MVEDFLDERIIELKNRLEKLKEEQNKFSQEKKIDKEILDTYLITKSEIRDTLENLEISKISDIGTEGFFPIIEFLEEQKTKFLSDFTGIYIIHNITKNKYYVGQGINVNRRMIEHFSKSKSKNGIYADFINGDSFEYKQIKLSKSGYDSLQKLEKDYIEKYRGIEEGYNSIPGNDNIF